MTPLEIIGASVLTVVMDFMKSGGINPKHEITIKDNKDEKEKVKKLIVKINSQKQASNPTNTILNSYHYYLSLYHCRNLYNTSREFDL